MHVGAQLRGLRAPCERFAPWVTPGPRITRFRLAADLGRMGLDTHRVSNKVSKITSRHLVPLDRAFPAHALAHVVRDKVEAAYARSDLFERRRHLMNDCEEYLNGQQAAWTHPASDAGLETWRSGTCPIRSQGSGGTGREDGRITPSGHTRGESKCENSNKEDSGAEEIRETVSRDRLAAQLPWRRGGRLYGASIQLRYQRSLRLHA